MFFDSCWTTILRPTPQAVERLACPVRHVSKFKSLTTGSHASWSFPMVQGIARRLGSSILSRPSLLLPSLSNIYPALTRSNFLKLEHPRTTKLMFLEPHLADIDGMSGHSLHALPDPLTKHRSAWLVETVAAAVDRKSILHMLCEPRSRLEIRNTLRTYSVP